MIDFFRFPHTPHLAWLGKGKPREDKVLDDAEARAFLLADIIVEEKVDGANLGFSVDERGELRAQNRGKYLDLGSLSGQWKPLRQWLGARRHSLTEHLTPNLMLFGEWCYAVHSIRYTRLPDWFVAFDVYDRSTDSFWSTERRNALVQDVSISRVPELGRGVFTLSNLKSLLGRSALTDGPAEGLYVRREEGGWLRDRAKLVRAEFVQAIGDHWSKRHLEENQIVRTAL